MSPFHLNALQYFILNFYHNSINLILFSSSIKYQKEQQEQGVQRA